MRHLAIIPIQKKQIQELLKLHNGKPIIAHCIESVIQTKLFDEIMVYTQDEQIAKIAKYYRASIPFSLDKNRIKEEDTLTEKLLNVLSSYRSQGVPFRYACSINPFTKHLDHKVLVETYKKLQKDRLDTIFPIISYKYPIQKAFKLVNEQVHAIQTDKLEVDKDNLEVFYHDCEQFYWFNTKKLRLNKNLFTKKTGGFIIPEKEKKINNQAYLQSNQIRNLYENNYNFQS